MEEQQKTRKRIPYIKKSSSVIEDPLAFVQNKCSGKARKIDIYIENIHIDLWFDKHYVDRYQHGDDHGKREGIDPGTIRDIVTNAIKHLFLYSSLSQKFNFINYQTAAAPVRIILQQEIKGETLNIVIETHY